MSGVSEFKWSAIDYYKIVRSEIQHEDDLINQRVTWLVYTQAILFGAFFVLFTTKIPCVLWDRLSLTVMTLGIVSDVILILGICLAFRAVRKLRALFYQQLAAKNEDATAFPDPVVDDWGNKAGVIVASALPTLFLCGWVYVFFAARWCPTGQ